MKWNWVKREFVLFSERAAPALFSSTCILYFNVSKWSTIPQYCSSTTITTLALATRLALPRRLWSPGLTQWNPPKDQAENKLMEIRIFLFSLSLDALHFGIVSLKLKHRSSPRWQLQEWHDCFSTLWANSSLHLTRRRCWDKREYIYPEFFKCFTADGVHHFI